MLTTRLSLKTIFICLILLLSQSVLSQKEDFRRRSLFGLAYGVGTNIGQGRLHALSEGIPANSTLLSQVITFNIMFPLSDKGSLQFDGIARDETYHKTYTDFVGVMQPAELNVKNSVLGAQIIYLNKWIDKEKFSLHGLVGLSIMDSNILSIVNGIKGVFSLPNNWNVISNLSHHSALGSFELNHLHLTLGIGIHINE